MCLATVSEVYKPARPEVRYAYKVFASDDVDPDQLRFEYQLYHDSRVVPRGQWLTAENALRTERVINTKTHRLKAYPLAFHCYATRRDATRRDVRPTRWSVVRVRVRGILAEGQQGGSKVIVAREMFVPKARRANGTR